MFAPRPQGLPLIALEIDKERNVSGEVFRTIATYTELGAEIIKFSCANELQYCGNKPNRNGVWRLQDLRRVDDTKVSVDLDRGGGKGAAVPSVATIWMTCIGLIPRPIPCRDAEAAD